MNSILQKKRRLVSLLCLILSFCLLIAGCKDQPTRNADKLFKSLNVTAPDGEAVRQARAAYDALNEKQRGDLEYLNQFLEAEKEYQAQEVDALISSIGTVSLESGPAIEAAKKAYEALDKDAAERVRQMGVLADAEKEYAARGVDALIDAIGTVSLESGPAIETARKAYDALDKDIAAKVKKLDALEDAEKEYTARGVDALIDSIGTVSLESGPAIETARKAYDALDKDIAAKVKKLDVLEKAEADLHRAVAEHAALEIDSRIEAIGTVTLESWDAIEAARNAYASADPEVAGLVSRLPELENAEKEFHHLKVLRDAEAMDREILSLGTITLESGPDIEAVRARYEALDEEVKKEVRELGTLTEAEEQLVYLGRLAEAEKVDQAIDALGEITPEKEADVAKVRRAYEQLPADVKALVKQLDVLENAEAALSESKDAAAAEEVKKLLDAKQYTDAIECAEKYIAGRDPGKIRGKLVEYCVKAYVAEANAQMNDKRYEEADNLLSTCASRYASANQKDLKTAQDKLKQAIKQPKNGQVFATKARGGYCELTIKSGDTPVFVKVISNKDKKTTATFYVRKNTSAKIKIKDGEYSLKYATGDKWYGEKELFGSGTRFYSADTTLTMKTTRKGNRISYQTYTVTLYTVMGGNLSTYKIPQDEF